MAIEKLTGSSDSGDPKMGPAPRRSYLDPETLSLDLTRWIEEKRNKRKKKEGKRRK